MNAIHEVKLVAAPTGETPAKVTITFDVDPSLYTGMHDTAVSVFQLVRAMLYQEADIPTNVLVSVVHTRRNGELDHHSQFVEL